MSNIDRLSIEIGGVMLILDMYLARRIDLSGDQLAYLQIKKSNLIQKLREVV